MKSPLLLALASMIPAALLTADEPKAAPLPQPAVAAPAVVVQAVVIEAVEEAKPDPVRRVLRPGGIRALPAIVAPMPPNGDTISSSASPTASRRNVEAVYLKNGDIISGKFVGLDPKDGLVWEHPTIKPALKIDPASVARVTFAPRAGAPASKRQSSRVQLSNGDQLAGDLFEMDARKLVLKTWYGGDLALSRASLLSLVPGEETMGVLFDGPADDKGWEFSNVHAANIPINAQLPAEAMARIKAQASGAFQYKDGGFESTGVGAQVGRNFELPDRMNLEFDIEWSTSMSFFVNLHTDQLKSADQGNTYSLRFTQSSAWLYKYERGDNFSRSSHVGTSAQYNLTSQLGARPMARVSIRVDKPQKTIALLINGQFVHKWVDTGTFAGKGKGLVFSTRTTYPVRLSGIRLSQWDGNLPGKVEVAGGSDKEDFVRLANSDTLSGTLLDIKEGKMTFKTPFADNLPIPLNRISVIRFAKAEAPATAQKNPVRISLKNQGQITCTLKEWKDGKVHLSSPTLGDATIDASVVESVDFVVTSTAATPVAPVAGTATTRININGADVPQELLEQIQGAVEQFQINGANIQVLPFLKPRIAPPLKAAPDIKRD